jgi:outer membrane protein TolC
MCSCKCANRHLNPAPLRVLTVKVRAGQTNVYRALEDRERTIDFEMRTAHSNFIDAREVLESQKKVVGQAEEALRLARARSEAGPKRVLSAQTALAESRTTEIKALHDYAPAWARYSEPLESIWRARKRKNSSS